jgi:hypothetical protein
MTYHHCLQYVYSTNTRLDTTEIGYRRIRKIQREYEQQGFYVLVNKNYNAGIDMIVLDQTGKICKVLEVTNYRYPQEYILDNKFNRYLESLNYYDQFPGIEKIFVVSFKENLETRQFQKLSKNHIQVRIEGKQD